MQFTDFELGDRYTRSHGEVFLSGIQALVRLPMEQSVRDRARGLNTAGYVTGYRGSPLSGLDTEFLANQSLLDERHVKFHAAVNEELAATALSGSQQVGLYAGARYDGVFGMWYGKAPGLDRAVDALRHGNQGGTSAHGGVLVVVGDDHHAKSSSVASYSETAFCDLDMPVLVPASVADVLDFGLYGWALSRYSGLWVGLVALADTMDSAMSLTRPSEAPDFSMPEIALDVHIREQEGFLERDLRLVNQKMPAVRAFVARHPIDRVFGEQAGAKTGIVASGRAYALMRETLARLGFMSEDDLLNAGLKILKVGMAWPLDTGRVEKFARGLERILVLEEGRAFIEHAVRSALYGRSSAEITGKQDAFAVPQLSEGGEYSNAEVLDVVSRFLDRRCPDISTRDTNALAESASTGRNPLFCAGCPHNRSTRLPDGSRALVGIGCHTMASWLGRETNHFCSMGGEGAMWLGQAPFTDEKHIYANLGDGTYFHSGILAIRAAIAARVNITYKLLYNHAVAMTGGQPVDGEVSVKSIHDQLVAEGVARIIVLSDDPERTRESGLDVPVRHRDHLNDAQLELRDTPGCTVLLFDQSCATELRRKRKRGLAATPRVRAYINHEVCEGCGDCSVQSSCVAVEPLQTELGTKRRINQSACNLDLSCVRGFCPSFVLIEDAEMRKEARDDLDLKRLSAETPLPELPETQASDFECNIGLAGVGGGGISTASAILGIAGHMDGLKVKTLDMTGLAQKGGAVTAHVRFSRRSFTESSPQMPEELAHVLIGVDLITAASPGMLKLTHPARTRAFVNMDVQNTLEFVQSGQMPGADLSVEKAFRRNCRSLREVSATELCQRFLGDGQMTNMLMLGFVWQAGEIPVSREALYRAIELNGVRVSDNIAAFELGRVAFHDESRLMPAHVRVEQHTSLAERMDWHEARLTAYQDADYAARHRRLVERVKQASSHLDADTQETLLRAVAEHYARLLACKDEFEVARLYSDKAFQSGLRSEFSATGKLRVLLAPPFLPGTDPSTGRPRKRAFGPWIFPLFRVLAKLKWLRKTRFNPFGQSEERHLERRLVGEYEATINRLCTEIGINHDNVQRVIALAALPDMVRGFGPVKLESVRAYKREREALLKALLVPQAGAPTRDDEIYRQAA